MNNFRPITSGLSDVYERVLDTEHRSVKSIWQDNVKYAIQWMPNGTIVLREHRQPFSSNKATRKITILTEWKRDSRGRIATLYLSMILSKRESDIDRNSFIVRRVEADWWASTDTGQSRMFESGWAKIYDTEAATVHNNSMLVTCASKSPAPSQNQGSTKQLYVFVYSHTRKYMFKLTISILLTSTQAYETTRSVIFPNRRKGDLKMEIIYDRMGDKPVSKRIFVSALPSTAKCSFTDQIPS